MVQAKKFRVPLDELLQHVNPLDGAIWGCAALTEAEVNAAVKAERFESRNWDQEKGQLYGPQGRDFHIQRIAYFVKHGLPSDEHSIRLNMEPVGDKQMGIDNENHRIAAASLRNDPTIDALLYFFDLDDIKRLLPGATEQP